MRWSVAGFLRCRGASAAIEFAIVTPVLLLFLFGIFTAGMYCAVVNGLEQLAAGAARQTIAGLTDTERANLATAYVTASAGTYPYLTRSALSATVTSASSTHTTTVLLSYDTSKSPAFSVASGLLPIVPRMLTRLAVVPQGGG